LCLSEPVGGRNQSAEHWQLICNSCGGRQQGTKPSTAPSTRRAILRPLLVRTRSPLYNSMLVSRQRPPDDANAGKRILKSWLTPTLSPGLVSASSCFHDHFHRHGCRATKTATAYETISRSQRHHSPPPFRHLCSVRLPSTFPFLLDRRPNPHSGVLCPLFTHSNNHLPTASHSLLFHRLLHPSICRAVSYSVPDFEFAPSQHTVPFSSQPAHSLRLYLWQVQQLSID